MRRLIIKVFMAFHVLLLASCVTTKQTNLLQETGGGIPGYQTTVPLEEYKVKSGDQLKISVAANPKDTKSAQLFSSFSGGSGSSFPVNPDGTIYFPYLGDVFVRGKNTFEIQQTLEKRINDNIVDGCIVLVSLESRYFSIIGEAGAGRHPIAKEQTTIFQALALSGGIAPYGDRSHVKIIRQIENGTVIKTFDLRSEEIINSEFYYIQPDDVIYIQPMGRKFLGLNSFSAGFAVLSTVISLGLMAYSFFK